MSKLTGYEVAVIGIDGRFPKADNVNILWRNLLNKVQGISKFDIDETENIELFNDSIDLGHQDYVRAKGILDGIEFFDADFFDYTPAEAMLMNPQMRLVHECAWKALEDAGYNPLGQKNTGLFLSISSSLVWEIQSLLSSHADILGIWDTSQYSNAEFSGTRVAYKLNLNGPVLIIQTACSSSLVSIHQAYRSLLMGECNMALAGGVSIILPQKQGYMYREGIIKSPTGECRAFDEEACGTNGGNGLGLVVLKLLKNAERDGDNIYAVIKGSAINNDGNRKVSYSAPSVIGQEEVIRNSLKMSGVSVDEVKFIETHGTGTALGDVVEVESLKKIFRTRQKSYCALSSIKSAIGHLNTAAGVAGFIKACLILKNNKIPPQINFTKANPKLQLEDSPFYVNTSEIELEGIYNAAVSSFGIGGTNANIVLENKIQKKFSPSVRKKKILCLSAHSNTALAGNTKNLYNYLQLTKDICADDLCYTLNVGRKALKYRKYYSFDGIKELSTLLKKDIDNQNLSEPVDETEAAIVFLLSGQGSQYLNMSHDLYVNEPIFRQEIDDCFDQEPAIHELKKFFTTKHGEESELKELINLTHYTQVLLFILNYALARFLIKLGIKPACLLGHSLGEYIAACLSGVFLFKDGLEIIRKRGELMNCTENGRMLSISISEDKFKTLFDGYSIAAVNSAENIVVSGAIEKIHTLSVELDRLKINYKYLHTVKSFHSELMEPILEEFGTFLKRFELNQPKIPFFSNVSGKLIKGDEATSIEYWKRHIVSTVRFSDSINYASEVTHPVFVEVGPGNTLASLVRAHNPKLKIFNTIRHVKENTDDVSFILKNLGGLWNHGVNIDWEKYYAIEKRRRISLPTYEFDKTKYPVNILDNINAFTEKRKDTRNRREADITKWFYQPIWKQYFFQNIVIAEEKTILIFNNDNLLYQDLVNQLNGRQIISVKNLGTTQNTLKADYEINYDNESDFKELFEKLKLQNRIPQIILTSSSLSTKVPLETQEEKLLQDYYSTLNIAKYYSKFFRGEQVSFVNVSFDAFEVWGSETIDPTSSLVIGALETIHKEFEHIRTLNIDLTSRDEKITCRKLFSDAINSLDKFQKDITTVALRGNYFWVPDVVNTPVSSVKNSISIKENGVYVIAGGLGGIGITIADYLATQANITIHILSRNYFKYKENWETLNFNNTISEENLYKIKMLRKIKESGSNVLIHKVDISDLEALMDVFSKVYTANSTINGIVHTAGIADKGIILSRTKEQSNSVFAAKVKGTLNLYRLLKNKPDFWIFSSSISSFLYPVGQVAYNSANLFLDSFSRYLNKVGNTASISINWDGWNKVGMLAKTFSSSEEAMNKNPRYNYVISPREGQRLMPYIFNNSFRQIILCTQPLKFMVEEAHTKTLNSIISDQSRLVITDKGNMTSDEIRLFHEKKNTVENKLINIFKNIFGYDTIDLNSSFFEIGGNSLKAISVVDSIKREYRIDFTLKEFFATTVISELVRLIKQKTNSSGKPLRIAEKKEYYPLSGAQQRLFVLHEIHNKNLSYNITNIVRITGDLSIQQFEMAVKKLVERHEALRTIFKVIEGTPKQLILDSGNGKLNFIDCRNEKDDPNSIISGLIKPFEDLSSHPYHFDLIQVEDNEYLFVLDIHHIISDGASFKYLMEELICLYNGDHLNQAPFQYKEFATYENIRKNSDVLDLQREFWLKEMRDEIPVINLNYDYTRPDIQVFDGDTLQFKLEDDIVDKLKQIAKTNDVTLFILLYSVFYILLQKLTNQTDIIIGIPTIGRNREEFSKTVGMFANTMIVRNNYRGKEIFSEVLRDTQNKILEVFENQDFSFEDIVALVQPDRDLSRNPLFDIMFIYNSNDILIGDINHKKVGNLEFKNYPLTRKVSKFDITLTCNEGKSFNIIFEYNTNLFKKSTIERYFHYFQNIIDSIITKDNKQLSEIELMNVTDRSLVLDTFNNSHYEIPDLSIIDLIEKQARLLPDSISIVFEDQHISYKQLMDSVNLLATHISYENIQREERIGILLDRSWEMLIAMLAVLKMNGAYVPIDNEFPEDRIKYIINNSNISLLITKDYLIHARKADEGTRIIDIAQFDWSSLKQYGNFNKIESKDLAYVIYTSGSSGLPKGIMIEHKSVTNFVEGIAYLIPFSTDTRFLSLTTISFDIFVLESFIPLAKGSRLVIGNAAVQRDAEKFRKIVENERINMIQLTPSRLKQYMDEFSDNKYLKQVNNILVGGEELPLNLLNNLRSTGIQNIYNMYGPTETTVWSSVKRVENEITIGKPIANTQLYIIDKNTNPLPVGISGELCIGGYGLARGYWNNEGLTLDKFITWRNGERIYKTGDLAVWKENGEVAYLGRMDHQIKFMGYRIEPSEIEFNIKKFKGITNAIVVKNTKQKNSLVAYYTTNTSIDHDELRHYLFDLLPRYMIPNLFVKIDQMPMTNNGKINRKLLPEVNLEIKAELHKPGNALEEELIEIWSEVLKIKQETIGTNSNFFELGGNSISLVKLNRILKEKYKIDISVVEMFMYPSIQGFVSYMKKDEQSKVKGEHERSKLVDVKNQTLDIIMKLK